MGRSLRSSQAWPRAPFLPPRAQHRLQEGFLRRLACEPDAHAFVLRGGMRVRELCPAAGRRAQDVDLLCALPYSPPTVRALLGRVLADRSLDDGVGFDPERLQLRGVWRGPHTPALILRARGAVGPDLGVLSVDLVFGLPASSTVDGDAVVPGLAPEDLVGRKVQITVELGRSGWRAKDLADIERLLPLVPTISRLGEAVERAFDHGRGSFAEAAEVFTRASWWEEPRAARRWSSAPHGRSAEAWLAAAEVRAGLAPIFRRSR